MKGRSAGIEERRRWGVAWVVLTAALTLHVLDEAAHDFLSFYNPAVESIRSQFPWLLLPTLGFSLWLGLLGFAVGALSVLSVLVFKGKRGMRPISRIYAWLMIANALFHVAVALDQGRAIAGVLSAPLLVAGAVFLLRAIPRRAPEPGGNQGLHPVPGGGARE